MSAEGRFSCYMDGCDDLDYMVMGTGETAQEARDDFNAAYRGMRDHYAAEGKPFQAIDYDFSYDYGSILAFYEGKLSMEGLHRITGVPASRLRTYVNGDSRPSPSTVRRIFSSLRSFGTALSSTAFL